MTAGDLARLSREAIEKDLDWNAVLAGAHLATARYEPLRPGPPLCFLHIPKTGGASVGVWLESQFHAHERAPCYSPADFDRLAEKPHGYRLFAGHIRGHQLSLLPADCQVFTLLRSPAQIAISAYHHLKRVEAGDWEAQRADVPGGDPLRGDDAFYIGMNEALAPLANSLTPAEFLANPHPAIRYMFYDCLSRILGAADDERTSKWDPEALERQLALERTDAVAARARALLRRMLLVGDHAQMGDALLLLAAERGWPAPRALPSLHDFRAPTLRDAKDPAVEAIIARVSATDLAIYQESQSQRAAVRARLTALCGAPTAEAVDAAHRARFFAGAAPVVGLDVSGAEPWNGFGWSLRMVAAGVHNRRLAQPDASILVRLDPTVGDYRLRVDILHAGSMEALDGLQASLGGQPLPRLAQGWRPSGAALVEWRLPHAAVADLNGQVELGFHRPAGQAEDALWLSRIACLPEPA